MIPFFEACLAANRKISSHISKGLGQIDRHKSTQGAGGDISSGIDLLAEEIFVKHLSSFGRIVSEESGEIGEGTDTIIIDPIDGSSNILSDFPYFGTSVALVDADGATRMACVCNLAIKEIYFKTAREVPLRGDLFGDHFALFDDSIETEIGIFERSYAKPDMVKAILDIGMKFRSPGAVALSLVYARNSLFFLYCGEHRVYDFAAGLLFCEDMEVEVNDQYVIVSKDKKTLQIIHTIVTEKRSRR